MIKSYYKIFWCSLLLVPAMHGLSLFKFLPFLGKSTVGMSPEIKHIVDSQKENAKLKLWLRRAVLFGTGSYLYREGIISFDGGKAKGTLAKILNNATTLYGNSKEMYNSQFGQSKIDVATMNDILRHGTRKSELKNNKDDVV
jgi:hypothetical protein